MSNLPKVLLIAESANPEWVSVPLEGWSLSEALSKIADIHLVTQVRNRPAITSAGWHEGRQFTAIDNEYIARPLHLSIAWLRKMTGLGWTATTAVDALAYYSFEWEVCKAFGAALLKGEYQLVHRLTPISPTAQSYFLPRLCRKAGIPFVWGPVNGGVPWPKQFSNVQRQEGEWLSWVRDVHRRMPGFRLTRETASALIAGSRSAWQQFDGYHDKTFYIPENALDTKRFSRTEHDHQVKVLRIAFIGRLVPYKGADMLIEAAAPLARAGQVEIDIIGDGPQRNALLDLVDRLELQQYVKLDGWVEHTKLQERLAPAHIFGFPSVREFGGAVVLEAMACGLVPVVVGYGGPDELVSDDLGFRVPLGTREEIVAGVRQALARLTEDRALLASMSRNAQQRAFTAFTWEAKARLVLEVYRWVLGERLKPVFEMPRGSVAG